MEAVQNRKLVNDCAECQAFDDKTKSLFEELFSTGEITTLMMMVAGSIFVRDRTMKTTSMPEATRIAERMNLDILAAILGKFQVALNPVMLKSVQKKLLQMGVVIKVSHQKCPHTSEVPV